MTAETGHRKYEMDIQEHATTLGFTAVSAVIGWLIKEMIGLKQWRAGHDAAMASKDSVSDSVVVTAKNAAIQAASNGKSLDRIMVQLDALKKDLDAMNRRCITHLARVAGNHETRD